MRKLIKYRWLLKSLKILAFAGLFIALSSCCDDRGRDGRPGRAYLALEWEVDIPDYLDVGTPDIPATFEWGRYYRAYPGWYEVYYEGNYFNGSGNVSYAWEMEYEIWETEGERGGYYSDGEDGPDTFFDLLISPYGPLLDEYVDTKVSPAADYKIISQSADSVEVLIEGERHSLHAIYRKVEPRNK